MKKTLFSIAMLAVLGSSTAFAYSDYAATPTMGWQFPPVTIPLYQGHFMFAAEGDYNLVTNATSLGLVRINTAAPNATRVDTNLNNSQNSAWGYRLYAGYTFPNSGNDIELIWQDFNTSHSTATSASDSFNLNPIIITAYPGNFTANNFTSKVSYNYKYLDFVVGQHFDFGCALDARLFGGLRFVDLKQTLAETATFAATGVANPADSLTLNSINKFRGVGLRGGVDGDYKVGYGFAVTGTVGAALIPVSLNNSLVIATVQPGTQGILSNPILQIAPEWDGRLGLKYAYSFANDGSDENSVGIEGGYNIETYFNSLSGFRMRGPYVKAEVNF